MLSRYKLRFMKLQLLIFLIFTFSACNALQPQNEVIELDGQHWQLTSIRHKPVPSSANAYLEFSKKSEVKGKAFCNSITGEYELMGKDQLTFGSLTSTKMYCEGVMNLENEMITNMENVKRYEIKNNMLYLYNSDEVLLAFKKE